MTRLSAIFWLVLVVVAGFTTFKVKYAVQDIEDELNRVRKQTIAEQQEIRVLTAEWTYLNQPERLAELNKRFLGLAPVTAKQLQHNIADIPLRAPAADMLVAANPAAPPMATPAALAGGGTKPAAGPVAPAALAAATAKPVVPVRLATAPPPQRLASLDALIAQIVETR